ncbi:hypothetical protein VP01_5219g2 [Puccinia sorghi]|uniref:Uncharacterized protein n=1 Tax=Puccinia sorghi TaxID=27349 RepID=A0A0L6UKM7_9BASI|nr:hypothetical protein VP01_5219g2 [Puccinia sorghi]
MALVKLEDYQMAFHNIKKPSIRVPSFQTLLCRKVKTRPEKRWINLYSLQPSRKKSHGPILKTHIFKGYAPLLNDLNCFVQDLSLKLVAWHHKGIFFVEPIVNSLEKHGLQRKIRLELPWDYDTMHIKCFCHKMVFFLNAGLNKLVLEAPTPPKLKKYFLEAVPYLNNLKHIAEEEEEEYVVDEEGSDNEVNTYEIGEGEEDMSEEDNDDKDGNDSTNCASQQSNKKRKSGTNRKKSKKLHELTQNYSQNLFHSLTFL